MIPSNLRFRRWLTIEEATTALNRMLEGDEVSEADVSQTIIDGSIPLSINFPRAVLMRELVPIAEHDQRALIWCLAKAESLCRYSDGQGFAIAGRRAFARSHFPDRDARLVESAVKQEGVFDFPLVASQRDLVIHKLHAMQGDQLPPPECNCICVASSGRVWQLQETDTERRFKSDMRWLPARTIEPIGRLVLRTSDVLKFFTDRLSGQDGDAVREAPLLRPWGKHQTELLFWVERAAIEFWSDYDPKAPRTAPKNSTVKQWIRSESKKKVSEHMAASIATILRADDLPTGPKPIG